MSKVILVPLDGSHLAEAVLPAASMLAARLKASVSLLHLIEHNAPPTVHGDRHLRTAEEALAYLNEVAARGFPDSVKVDKHVHTVEVTNVPMSIVEHAAEMSCELIALCTHGNSGLKHFFYGSIAQQVAALGRVPVLLLRPATAPEPFHISTMLVPLDGKPEHEQGMNLATEIARACGASLKLLRVVPTLFTLSAESDAPGKLMPATMTALLDLTEQEAESYLAGLVNHHPDDVKVIAGVERGDPVEIILADSDKFDVIVLTTHGKRGTAAFWSGSVAPKIALQANKPLLLVKANG